MKENTGTPPILLIVYKRPDATRLVFEEIRKARPQKLFIGADGPKEGNSEDAHKVDEVRKIVQNVDWDCDVKTLFYEKNVGSRITESSAISFFFDNVEEGIILEDDCLPDQSFFRFCRELLEKYRNDKRVMHISGNNFQFGRKVGNGSYYFSRFSYGWGWASWKRAWNYYDVEMKSYPAFKAQNQIRNVFKSIIMQQYYMDRLDEAYNRQVDCWDNQWGYAIWSQNGICIVPNMNLVSNIGFGPDGTYCTDKDDIVANIDSNTMLYIIHPDFMLPDDEVDKAAFEKINHYTYLQKLKKYVWIAFSPVLVSCIGESRTRELKGVIRKAIRRK
jgi:hypothetical protein